MASDVLALVIAELGSLAERQAALLIDTNLSGLPPFLIEGGGLNSGFMVAHVTAAALAFSVVWTQSASLSTSKETPAELRPLDAAAFYSSWTLC